MDIAASSRGIHTRNHAGLSGSNNTGGATPSEKRKVIGETKARRSPDPANTYRRRETCRQSTANTCQAGRGGSGVSGRAIDHRPWRSVHIERDAAVGDHARNLIWLHGPRPAGRSTSALARPSAVEPGSVTPSIHP